MVTQSRPRWYKPDMGLAARMLLTMFLLGAVYVGFILVLSRAFHFGLIPLIAIALILAVVQLFFADKIALASMGAHIVEEAEAPELHAMIGRLAAQANLPKPQIAIVNTSIPNAFATGRSKNHAVIAVTTGLLNSYQLTPAEIEAVLAHELTHILNRDMLVMTIATFFSMVAAIILQNFFWLGGGYGGRRNRDEGNTLALVLLASLVVYVVSFLLTRMLSRYRELAADRGAALITGAPEHLASALIKITDTMQNPGIPKEDFRKAEAANALWLVPALRGDSLAVIFSSHPSTEERVRRLQEMQKQMEDAKYLG